MEGQPAPSRADASPASRPLVATTVGVYAGVAIVWVWLSDHVLSRLQLDPQQLLRLETYKGVGFVVVTSLLLWAVLARMVRQLRSVSRLASERHSDAVRSEAILAALSESSTDAIFAKDLDGRYLLFNREAGVISGKRIEDVLGQDDRTVFNDRDGAVIRANDLRVMQQDQVLTFEEELETPGRNERRTFLSAKGPLRDAQNRVIGLFGVSRDISEMVRARRRLQEGEQRWRRLFKANPQPMWVFDRSSRRFLAVNEAATVHYGWSRDEFLAMTIDDIRPTEDVPRLHETIAAPRSDDDQDSKRGHRWRHRCKDGREIEVEIASSDIEFDGHDARLVLAVDMTERVRLERERERALRELSDVLGRITDGFFALDNDDRFVYVTPRGAMLAGRASPADMLGRVMWDLFPEERGGPFDRACREARSSRLPAVDESRSSRLGRWFEYHVYASDDGVTVYFSDVTARHEAYQALREREAALRQSELRYRLAASSGHVWDWDIEGGRSYTPTSFWNRLGIVPPPDELAVAQMGARMHPEDEPRWRDALRGHIAHHRPYELDFRMRHADGTWRWFHTQGQAVWNDQGRATYMAGTTFDVTDQRRAEASLLASQQELSKLSQRLLDQERETTRHLAQALHDRLGQTLASARLFVDVALQAAPAPKPVPLTKLSELLDSAVAQVRDVLMDLRPPMLDTQGLARSLRDEVVRQAAGHVRPSIELQVERASIEGQRWPDAVEYAAFMVAREAVTNALHHADADSVHVSLDGDADRLVLSVHDDGIGIGDGGEHVRPGHLGMVGMRERAMAVGAQLRVGAAPEGGTTVGLVWHRAAPSAALPS